MKSARRCQGGSKNTSCKMTSCINQHKMEGMQMNSDTHFAIHRACAILNHIKIHTNRPFTCSHNTRHEMRQSQLVPHWLSTPTRFWGLHCFNATHIWLLSRFHKIWLYQALSAKNSCVPRVSHAQPWIFFFSFFFFNLIKSVNFKPPKFTKDQDFSPMPFEL